MRVRSPPDEDSEGRHAGQGPPPFPRTQFLLFRQAAPSWRTSFVTSPKRAAPPQTASTPLANRGSLPHFQRAMSPRTSELNVESVNAEDGVSPGLPCGQRPRSSRPVTGWE